MQLPMVPIPLQLPMIQIPLQLSQTSGSQILRDTDEAPIMNDVSGALGTMSGGLSISTCCREDVHADMFFAASVQGGHDWKTGPLAAALSFRLPYLCI